MANYGFIIDNRKCIGCHACTVACKAEHEVPLGVNRTWVKYIEKGEFPDTQRAFHVMRCNHCEDAPCVEACPVTALYVREDGIVDFNWDRCIGCKACTQACPYDALYIDPESHTAAKCNYCAHRVDMGLEPACVNVCPEQAIISGDMDDPASEISRLLAREKVTVRRPEKGTKPKLFYINGDEAALTPEDAPVRSDYMWSNQRRGVGHHAPSGRDGNASVAQGVIPLGTKPGREQPAPQPERARRTYDEPNKGVMWGKEVPGYVFTKALASGAVAIPFLAAGLGLEVAASALRAGAVLGLVFMALTGILLIMDLDRPDRFHYVLLRPQWRSWLVRGAYIITGFGGLITLWLALELLGAGGIATAVLSWPLVVLAAATAVYTAFLFAQARGRSFWQSPALPVHMGAHTAVAGAAVLYLASFFVSGLQPLRAALEPTLVLGLLGGLFVLWAELGSRHPDRDAERAAKMIYGGRYRRLFWGGSVALGSLLPLALTVAGILLAAPVAVAVAGALALLGILITEHVWVEAPQLIPLA
ncbi:4Fe-4S ferredoxin, iron-sulfur binding protein [Rubrobacter xylanophilus DSM 9941]|uniref:4Fe-4S ferredoxin, iron-sulfur binding protein n=1 Tax=Rubrobacter xylanophilus (strain DSM 9941 / JCM 11954 / NBRC 16129 / PRD-1) TaxID=266117 RepID=Q1AVK3_RUBXD|nr:NrfD/PsrC family molybdoenzyme membrane anchor subunit [Rubrobacter xylanophilus]ABG04575.1 4Fe-4S ferredoxin, iron-sulfur binding protein [Rubrobacter xylanophilus DSM 9941]